MRGGDDGMIIFSSVTSTVMFPEVFVGPATFYPAKGKVQTQSVTLPNADFDSFQRTFALVIQNGDGGSNTAQSVTVAVNGFQVFSSNNLRRDPLVITQMIYELVESTTIDVQVKGKDGSFVTIWIEGTDLEVAKSTAEYGTCGALYNRGAAVTTACPTGWRLPSEADFGDPEYYLEANGLLHKGHKRGATNMPKPLQVKQTGNYQTCKILRGGCRS